VLKHEVLHQYVEPYAGMAGSTNPEGRVVLLDGYAGEGRYADGSPGSPLLALETAKSLLPTRVLECVFVEKERRSFVSLQAVVGEYKAQGVKCEAIHGRVEDHLDAVVQQATGVPLFMFLDPCGLAPPYGRLVAAVTGSRAGTYPPTEVLLNFSDKAVRHIGGQLRPECDDRSGVAALDSACGGDWWQAMYTSSVNAGDVEAGVQAVVAGFADRFGRDTHSEVVTAAVRLKPEHKPLYHLVFATRSNHGLWVFRDALAKAQKEWRAAQYDEEPDDPEEAGVLFGTADLLAALEDRLRQEATAAIRANLLRLLDRHAEFRLLDEVRDVFGPWYGIARETWVRQAIKDLHRDGLTSSTGIGKRVRELRVSRPS
jgi:three-Cys-motif partner protein